MRPPCSKLSTSIRFFSNSTDCASATRPLIRAILLLVVSIGFATAVRTQTITFETPTYTLGNINGQDGWSKTGGFDSAVSSSGGTSGFGAQSLRISNAVTSGSFGDMTFSRPLANEAGESTATNGGMSGGTRTRFFAIQFTLASAVPGAQQPGLSMSIAPDRGDGARMSYLRFEDQANGIHVFFDDFQDLAPFGGANGDDANGCNAGGDDFTDIDIATLTRTPHVIKIVMTFVDGPRNDIVRIYIDGVLIKTGTSWEDYYRFCAEQSADNNTHTVDSLMMRTAGTPVPANAGNGYLFDNMTLVSTPTVVDDDGMGTASDCDAADPAFNTIQAAVSDPGTIDTVKVCPGTYTENVVVAKNLTLLGAQAGVDARGRVGSESIVLPAVGTSPQMTVAFSGTVAIDGFTFSGGPTGSSGAVFTSVGPNDSMQIVNNRFIAHPAAAVWLNRGGANITIEKNLIDGTNLAGGGQAIFANGPQLYPGLWINNNNIINHPGRYGFFVDATTPRTIGESSVRGFSISGNVFNNNLQGINAGSRSLGVTGTPVLGPYAGSVSNNTFSNNAFDGFQGGPRHTLFSGNSFINNGRTGIAFTSFGSADPLRGAQSNLVVGNTFSGNGFVNLGEAIFFSSSQAVGTISTNQAHFNRIIDNRSALNYPGAETINVENNWFGCNYGPGTGGTGCIGTPNPKTGAGAANLDSTPWLTLTTAAMPTSVLIGGNSTVTSKLTINSASADTAGSGTVPDTTPVGFAASLGSTTPTNSTLLGGQRNTVFTGTADGVGGVATTVDGQTVNAPIAVYATACAALSIPTVQTQNGVVVTVPVNTSEMTGRDASSTDFTITYNSAVLTPLANPTFGVTLGAVGTSNGGGRLLTVANPSAGTLIVSIFGANEFQGNGVLVNLNFTVIGTPLSSSPLNFSAFKYNEGSPCSTTTNGSISVISGTLSGTVTYGNALVGPAPPRYVPNVLVSAAGAPPQSTLTSSLGTYSLSGFGPGSYTITPTKSGGVNGAISGLDASTIAQFVVGSASLNSNQQTVADVSGAGGITSFDASMIAKFIVSLPGSGATGTWRFNPVNNTHATIYADITNENYSALLMGDVTGNWGDPTSSGGGRQLLSLSKPLAVSAAQVAVSPNSEVLVPIRIGDTGNRGIVAYQFELLYDPAVLTPTENVARLSGTLSDAMIVTANAETPGRLKVVVFGILPLNGEGVLLNLRFTAIGAVGTSSDLTWDNLMLNEGGVFTVTENGRVTVTEATANEVSISGRVLTALGQGVPNARVTLTGINGGSRTALSSSFGFYEFGNVERGQTYTLTVDGRRFIFNPVAVSVSGNLANLDLIAQP